MIQRVPLGEADFRAAEFAAHTNLLKGAGGHGKRNAQSRAKESGQRERARECGG